MGRPEEAQEIIRGAKGWSFVVGLCPLPWLDAAAITYVQLDMIQRLCSVYGVSYHEGSARALVTALVGALLPTALGANVARVAMRHLPGIGPLIATLSLPTTLGGSTAIVGKLVAQHFEAGGDLSNFGLKVHGAPLPTANASSPPEAATPPDSAKAEEGERSDDLTAINGIGPKIAGVLRSAKVQTFAKLAAMSPDELREILADAGPSFRSRDPSTWPAQAGTL